MSLIAGGVLLCCARLAQASCTLALEGDAETVARVEAALAEFPDDQTACVAVRVMCSHAAGEITLELRDELGRSAHRTVASPDGAAAFLISWSRRPLAFHASDRGAAASVVQVPAGPPDDRLHGEYHFTYLRSLDDEQASMSATAALVRRSGIWRYGGDLRLLGLPTRYSTAMLPVLWAAADATGSAGVDLTWRERIMVRGRITAGARYASMLSTESSNVPQVQAVGVHAGLRATLASRLVSAMWLEAGIAWDPVQASALHQDAGPYLGLAADPFLEPLRIEVGLLWAP